MDLEKGAEQMSLDVITIQIETTINKLYYYRNKFLQKGLYVTSTECEILAIKIFVKYTILLIEYNYIIGCNDIERYLPMLDKPIFKISGNAAYKALKEIINRFTFIKDIQFIKEALDRKRDDESFCSIISNDLYESIELEKNYPMNRITKGHIKTTLNDMKMKCNNIISDVYNSGLSNSMVENSQKISYLSPILTKSASVVIHKSDDDMKNCFVTVSEDRLDDGAFSNQLNLEHFQGQLEWKVGESCFSGCMFLKSVQFQTDSWPILRDFTFNNCVMITEVDLSNTNIFYIGSSCFKGCYNLSKITIPYTILYIGKDAFYGTKIEKIMIPTTCIFYGYDIDDQKYIGLGEKPMINRETKEKKMAMPDVTREGLPIQPYDMLYSLCKPPKYTKATKKEMITRMKEVDIRTLIKTDYAGIGENTDQYASIVLEMKTDSDITNMSNLFDSITDHDTIRNNIFLFSVARSIGDSITKFRYKTMREMTKDDYMLYYQK